MSPKISRRDFIKQATTGTLAFSTGLSTIQSFTLSQEKKEIEKRPLGKTGLNVTILGLGCAAIGYGSHSVAEGAKLVEACIDSGINYIDCASSYGNAEVKVGEAMKTRRKEVALTTKTLERDKEDAWREINTSLERLKTDHLDLLQIHSVNRMEELDRITSKDGSLAAAIRAKEERMCNHIGITGHTRPAVIREALNRHPFETTLVPLSSTDKLINDFGGVLFPLADKVGFGIIAMKVLAAGRVADFVPESLRYSFSLPISSAIIGMGTVQEVQQNVAIAKSFKPMSKTEMETLVEKTKQFATTSIMWWKRT